MSDGTIRDAGTPGDSTDAVPDFVDDLVIVPVSDGTDEADGIELFEADGAIDDSFGEATHGERMSDGTSDNPASTDGAVRITEDEVGRNVVVECPGCGLVCEGVDPRPTAAWFCPNCDYPLFLAAPAPPAVAANSGLARRRLPGTDGREMVSAEACWACGERNPIGTTACQRCNSQLVRPTPPVPLAPEPSSVDTEVEPLIFVARRWPLILGGALGGSLLTLLIVISAG